MIKKNIRIEKTARYFVLGNSSASSVWFVCHGYAQLASYFIKNFEPLNDGHNMIVAPEGLHRFYWQGYSGRVVASWMTREDRLGDIRDYVNYLDEVQREVMKEFAGRKVKVNVLGFSQGVATACRWLSSGKTKADNLIMWSGVFPEDLDPGNEKNILQSTKVHSLVGTRDEFIDEPQRMKMKIFLDRNAPGHTFTLFDGKHEIPAGVLEALASSL